MDMEGLAPRTVRGGLILLRKVSRWLERTQENVTGRGIGFILTIYLI
jgi:hypothetical protein